MTASRLRPASGGVRDAVAALRPRQWIKNVLVFVPLVAAHETSVAAWLAAAAAGAAACACAAAGYVLNDLVDRPHDRRHPSKRQRPLAAGRAPLRPTIGIAAALAAGGLALGFVVSAGAGLALLGYAALAAAYTLYLKRLLFLDVVALAALYGVRVVVGAAAAAIPLSPWLGAFSLLMFIALAIVKRQRELGAAAAGGASGDGALAGRAYRAEDRPALAALGAAAGFASVVVLALYVQGPAVAGRYGRPYLLWLICPLLTYWLGRMSLLANRPAAEDDPVAFALRDRASWLTAAGTAAAFAAAL